MFLASLKQTLKEKALFFSAHLAFTNTSRGLYIEDRSWFISRRFVSSVLPGVLSRALVAGMTNMVWPYYGLLAIPLWYGKKSSIHNGHYGILTIMTNSVPLWHHYGYILPRI